VPVSPNKQAKPISFSLKRYLDRSVKQVNAALNKHLPKALAKPKTLHESMRYSMFAGGKRLRPILCMAAAEACGGRPGDSLILGSAVECIHTYSLIHDDLPGMDNDDLRRGKPTNHVVYGEGIAVLAGDALLTLAFELVNQAKSTKRHKQNDFVSELAKAAGHSQLIAGQAADLEGEGKPVSRAQLRYIHERKTSALLTCSVRLGGMSANATPRQLQALTDFGYHVGLAFQVIDDILDVTQSSERLGKTAGKDVAVQKATYPSVVGLAKSQKIAAELTAKAYAALKPFKGRAVALEALADYLLKRDH
jgi:geranylgeranyl diphosphate synthase type II